MQRHAFGVDLVSADGTRVIEVKYGLASARDLHAALMQLAIYASAQPNVRLTLIAHLARVGTERIQSEWAQALRALKDDIANRLSLVAFARDGDLVLPSGDVDATELARRARRALDAIDDGESRTRAHTRAPWSSKSFEVWKVLFGAWLANEPALAVQSLQARSGTSYPTVVEAIERLDALGEITRTSSRGAQLRGHPRASLAEVLAVGDSLRRTMYFVDASGRAPDLDALLRRTVKVTSDAIAIGGVAAARHYDRDFDLNGLPRVDVTASGSDTSWLRSIDPALVPATALDLRSGRVALVVHRLRRPKTGFVRDDAGHRWFTDPVEVVLDLHELRLSEQADEFVDAVRRRGGAR